ncbi:MAG: hypothetical protein IK104_05075 [Clostridia bacterium]|nr:hypothetical protein [Clostridia bacterium]
MRSDEEMVRGVRERVDAGRTAKKRRLRGIAAVSLALIIALTAVLGVTLNKKSPVVLPAAIGGGYGFSATTAAEHRAVIENAVKNDAEAMRELMDSTLTWNLSADGGLRFTGEPVTLHVTATNPSRYVSEGGFSVLLDGVYQSVTLRNADGTLLEPAAMHPLLFNAKETKTFDLVFTPNVGKAGDTLTLCLGVTMYPSFEGTYYGDAYGYGFLGEAAVYPHRCVYSEPLTLAFAQDAPAAMSAAGLAVQTTAKSPAFSDDELKTADESVFPKLFTDPASEFAAQSVNLLRGDGENGLTVAFAGKGSTCRVTLMIDHAPVDLGGTTFTDVVTETGTVTAVTFPVDAASLGAGAHHVYATVVVGSGAYASVYNTPTEFLFVGEKPAPADLPPAKEPQYAPAGKVSYLGFSSIGGGMPFADVFSDGRLAVVHVAESDVRAGERAFYVYDPADGSLTKQAVLSNYANAFRLANDRLIAVDNPAAPDPHVRVYGSDGGVLSDVPFKTGLPSDEMTLFNYQAANGSVLISTDGGAFWVYCSETQRAFIFDVATGERTPVKVKKSTAYGTTVGMIGDRFLVEDYNEADDSITFSLVDRYENRVGGSVTLDSSAWILDGDGRFRTLAPRANKQSQMGNLPDLCYVLDCETLTLTPVKVRLDSEKTGALVSNDGSILVTHLYGQKITRVYDVKTGEELTSLGNISAWMNRFGSCVDAENRAVYIRGDGDIPENEAGYISQDIVTFRY